MRGDAVGVGAMGGDAVGNEAMSAEGAFKSGRFAPGPPLSLPRQGRLEDLAETIARALVAHPAVVRLDAGHFGDVATALPGRRVVGVRTGPPGGAVEVGVVLWLMAPIPALVGQLRLLVRELTGPVPVDVQVVDVLTDADMAAQRQAARDVGTESE
jgi:hypothetical protein